MENATKKELELLLKGMDLIFQAAWINSRDEDSKTELDVFYDDVILFNLAYRKRITDILKEKYLGS